MRGPYCTAVVVIRKSGNYDFKQIEALGRFQLDCKRAGSNLLLGSERIGDHLSEL
jgi:hypothetical protein